MCAAADSRCCPQKRLLCEDRGGKGRWLGGKQVRLELTAPGAEVLPDGNRGGVKALQLGVCLCASRCTVAEFADVDSDNEGLTYHDIVMGQAHKAKERKAGWT